MVAFDWTPIHYRTVISVLKNPFYAGAYVYGKSEKRTAIIDGRPSKTYGHGKPLTSGRLYSKGTTRVISTGQSSNGTKSNSPLTPMAGPGTPNRVEADGRFWPVFSPADIAGAG